MSQPIDVEELLARLGKLSQSGLTSMSASIAFWHIVRQLTLFSITVEEEEFWAHHPGATDTPALLTLLANLYEEKENHKDLLSVFSELLTQLAARGIYVHPYRFWESPSVEEKGFKTTG